MEYECLIFGNFDGKCVGMESRQRNNHFNY